MSIWVNRQLRTPLKPIEKESDLPLNCSNSRLTNKLQQNQNSITQNVSRVTQDDKSKNGKLTKNNSVYMGYNGGGSSHENLREEKNRIYIN